MYNLGQYIPGETVIHRLDPRIKIATVFTLSILIPTYDIAMMISVALRLMPLLLEELARIRAAQAARGADLTAGRIADRVKAAAALPVPLVLSAIRRADELADAMEARGYQSAPHTSLREMRITAVDAAALMSIFASTLVLTFLHPLDLSALVESTQALTRLHH